MKMREIINTVAMLYEASQGDQKPLAVIVKGNPKYISDPDVKPMADEFYDRIASILRDRGYRVRFNSGKEYTSPTTKAKVWIGHSRGIDRLRFAPDTVKTYALQTNDNPKDSFDVRGHDPRHYELSDKDLKALKKL